MTKKLIVAASFLGFFAIVLGAFAAHGLESFLTPKQRASFGTGVSYQMYHALFLFFVANSSSIAEQAKKVIYYTTLLGICFFSGSLYLLATNSMTPIDFSFVGPVTPIGGLLLLLAWGKLFWSIACSKK